MSLLQRILIDGDQSEGGIKVSKHCGFMVFNGKPEILRFFSDGPGNFSMEGFAIYREEISDLAKAFAELEKDIKVIEEEEKRKEEKEKKQKLQ